MSLLPRTTGRHEDNFVQSTLLRDLGGRNQMAVMDGSNVPPMTPILLGAVTTGSSGGTSPDQR